MDQATLVEADVTKGAVLIGALDEAGFDVTSAFWLYSPDREKWRLIIATPIVDKKGPRAAYRAIQKVLREREPKIDLDLRHISVVSPSDSLIQVLRRAIKTGPGISNIRYSRSVVDGTYIEDAVLYRV